MEINTWKTQVMTNCEEQFTTRILHGEEIKDVKTFKYLGSILDDKGSKKEIISRIAQTTSVLTKLSVIWNGRNIMLKSKIRLLHSLLSSIFLYACETWTITKELHRRISAMDYRCVRKILKITYKDRITNTEVRNRILQAIGPHRTY